LFSKYAWSCFVLAALAVCLPRLAGAAERGVMLREGVIYISPDSASSKLSNIGRGREVTVLERAPGWVHVVGTVDITYNIELGSEERNERNVTGWVVDKGVITPSVPDGDKIIFGEAFDSEMEASHRGGRRGAAQDAMRLYAGLAEYFPSSSLAAQAAYRAADIRWQLEAEDLSTRPSAKMRDPSLRLPIDEQAMKHVIKKYPGTKWADLAAYRLIDNKLCGDWQGDAKCPEMEAPLYIRYVEDHPQSPKAPEALYKAAMRYAALITMYKGMNQQKKSEDSAGRALSTAKKLIAQYPNDVDSSSRAERLLYMIQNNMPTYGPDLE